MQRLTRRVSVIRLTNRILYDDRAVYNTERPPLLTTLCDDRCAVANFSVHSLGQTSVRYDTRGYFNVWPKADISQLKIPHETNN